MKKSHVRSQISGSQSSRRLQLEALAKRELLAADIAASCLAEMPVDSLAEGESIEAEVFTLRSNAPRQTTHTQFGRSEDRQPQRANYGESNVLRQDADGYYYYYNAVGFLHEDPVEYEDIQPNGGNPSNDLPENAAPPQGDDGGTGGGGDDDGSGNQNSPPTVPAYSSRPGASKKIYLDFDGEQITGTTWNNRVYHNGYNTGSVIDAPAWSIDADLDSFSSTEQTRIREIWARVAEDFAPFDVDVTTIEPPSSVFTAGSQAIRVMMSTDTDATTGVQWYPNAGGVAYLNSWTWTNGSPVWVFANKLSNGEKNMAEAASHEIGHALDLRHDGTSSLSYYRGHGSGAVGWAPIMGVGYYEALSQWSRGTYTDANNQENDLSMINFLLDYIPDDHGDLASPTNVVEDGSGAVSGEGIISKAADMDAFSFRTQSGQVDIDFEPFEHNDGKANLDILVQLYDTTGSMIAEFNPIDEVVASISTVLTKGFYTAVVDGTGRIATSGNEGYEDYGSLGYFSFSGNVIPNNVPVAVDDTVYAAETGTSTLDVLGNDYDDDNDVLTLVSVGTASNGSLAIVNDQVEYTPNSGFLGTDTFSYTIRDELGDETTGNVTVEVIAAPEFDSALVNGTTDLQRSMVSQFLVTVVGDVTDNGAFSIERRNSDGSETGQFVSLASSRTFDGTNTQFMLTFLGGLAESNGSLVDGRYRLAIDGENLIDNAGQGLANDEVDDFFRLYGDSNGDAEVSGVDLLAFRLAFQTSLGDSGYQDFFDQNSDDEITGPDLLAFRSRFNTSV